MPNKKSPDLSESQKDTINAPAESLPIPGKIPAPEVPVDPEDNPLVPTESDGGEDLLSGLPRNVVARQVSEGTQENRPDVPKQHGHQPD